MGGINMSNNFNFDKVTFLFGAGADTFYGLPTGEKWMQVLFDIEHKIIKKLLKFDKTYQMVYPKSRTIFVESILDHKNDAVKVFGVEIIDLLEKYSDKSLQLNDEENQRLTSFFKECYDSIYNGKNNKYKEFFYMKCSFFSSLDSKFSSLRKKELNSYAKRIISSYYLLLFSMLFEEKQTLEINTLEKLFDAINSKKWETKKKTYYTVLKEKAGLRNNLLKIVTVNYTNILENVFNDTDVVYLHGKLTWFEHRKHLQVYDINCFDDRKLLLNQDQDIQDIIPFIMIPSGIKPIICRKQIEEYSKFINKLDDSIFLVVVGYKFNSEDNHINSIIANWLRKSKNNKIILFNYENSIDLSQLMWLGEEMISSQIEEIKIENNGKEIQIFEEIIERIFNNQ